MLLGVIGLPEGADIWVSFGRSTPQLPWQLDVVSAAIPLPSLGQLTQLAQGQDLSSLIKAGGLDQLHFVMTDLNFGLTIAPVKLTRLGFTLQLANADDPLLPVVDWDIIPGALTLTQFSAGFEVDWGTTVSKSAFGTFVLNGLEFGLRFASDGASDGLVGQYTALDTASGSISVKDLIASVAPGVAASVPDGLTITLAGAALAYLQSGGTSKFLFTMDISAGSAVAGLSLGPNVTAAIASLELLVVSAAMTAQDVTFINTMSSPPVLPAPPGGTGGLPAGFAFTASVADLNIGQLLSDLAWHVRDRPGSGADRVAGAVQGVGQLPERDRRVRVRSRGGVHGGIRPGGRSR